MAILSNIKAFWQFGDGFDHNYIADATGRGNHLTPFIRFNECTKQFRIGRRGDSPISGIVQQTFGRLKGWGKWNRLLTAAEKAALNSGEYWPFSTTTSLQDAKAYYLLDEAGGSGTYSDSTAGAQHLTATGTTVQVAGPLGSDFATQFTTGVYLTRDSPGVTLRSSQVATTIAGWVNLDSKPTTPSGVAQQVFWGQLIENTGIPGNTESGFNVYFDPTSDRFCYDQDAGDGKPLHAGSVVLDAVLGSPAIGTWYFLICEFDLPNNMAAISVNNGARTTLAPSLQPIPVAGKIGDGSQFTLNPAFSFATRTSGWDIADPEGNCHVSHTQNADLAFGNNSKTVWGWFRTDDPVPYQTIAGFYNGGGLEAPFNNTDWVIQISASVLYWVFGRQEAFTTATITDTNWHLIVAWYNTSTGRIYLNVDHGAQASDAAGPATPQTSTNPFRFGSDLTSADDYGHQFRGALNAWGIASGVPTQDDLDTLWNNGAGWSLVSTTSTTVSRRFMSDGISRVGYRTVC